MGIINQAPYFASIKQTEWVAEKNNLVRLLPLWGKIAKDQTNPIIFHPAIYHMIDAGNIASALLHYGSRRWKNIFSRTFSIEREDVEKIIPLLVSLHDIGKISSEFQGQVELQKKRLEAMGYSFGRNNNLHHSEIGQAFAFFDLDDQFMPKMLRLILRDIIAGHHGLFGSPAKTKNTQPILDRDEPSEWKTFRIHSAYLMKYLFNTELHVEWKSSANRSSAIMALTGFTILCDWLSSDELSFPPHPEINLPEYLEISSQQALNSIQSSGFLSETISHTSAEFKHLFCGLKNPRPLQMAINEIPSKLFTNPMLAIIEAPTGEGKTEAALALAHRIASIQGSDELFYALPTTATSNQMFIRLQKYLQNNLGLETQVKLIHSQAFLIEDDLRIKPLLNDPKENEHDLLEWFGPKKRALLAPFGIGTVDQAELGALITKHNALRMIGLAGKTFILDEVHAYDTYMTSIIEDLLSWLSSLGTSVILLSATLPQEKRNKLIHAYCSEQHNDFNEFLAYPSLIIANNHEIFTASPPASQNKRKLKITPLNIPDSGLEKAQWLLHQIQDGGCACWITNTVDRAQDIYSNLDRIAPPDVKRLLIHSRFCIDDRQELEKQISRWFGPNGNRPKGIVIGTQVLEQSLDLDFDCMVTDIAPIDLLLQRAGRLHRHNNPRPANHVEPCIYIYAKNIVPGNIDVSIDGLIYDEYILRKTWEIISERDFLNLPEDYRRVIEFVYSNNSKEDDETLQVARTKWLQKESNANELANQRKMPYPDPNETFCGKIANLTFEENEKHAGWIVAQTRLGEQSISLLPMEKTDQGISFPGIIGTFNQESFRDRKIQLQLLRRCVQVSHRGIVKTLNDHPPEIPDFITNSPLLKNIIPLWVVNNKAEIITQREIFTLIFDQTLGLVIKK